MPLPIFYAPTHHSNSELNYKFYFFLLTLIAIALLFLGIGFRNPWPADEPRFAEVAREMLQSGQWLIPQRGVEYYPDKPPLFMWAIGLFYWLTGNLKISFLLPNAIAGLVTLWLTFDLGARLWNVKTAIIATILLLITPQFLIQAKSAQIDSMVAMFIMIGCYGFIRHFILDSNWKLFCLSWFAMGLGIITKGVGFLPLFILIPIAYYSYFYRYKTSAPVIIPNSRSIKMSLLGVLLLALAIFLWVAPMLWFIHNNPTAELLAYKNNILFKQTAERYAKSWTHLQSWHYFLTDVIPLLWFPLPLLIIAHWNAFIKKLKTDPKVVILSVWVIFVILFFSLSPGKRGVYILPALPILCLAIASVVTDRINPKWFEIGLIFLLRALTLLMLTLGVLGLFKFHLIVKVAKEYLPLLPSISILLIILAIVGTITLWVLRKEPSLYQFFVCNIIVWFFFSTSVWMLLDPFRTPYGLMLNVQNKINQHYSAGENNAELGLVNFKEQFILFSPMTLTHFGYLKSNDEQQKQAWQWMKEKEARFLLVPEGTLKDMSCFDATQAEFIDKAHSNRWMLVSNSAMRTHCEPPKNKVFYTIEQPGRWIKE